MVKAGHRKAPFFLWDRDEGSKAQLLSLVLEPGPGHYPWEPILEFMVYSLSQYQ